MVSPHTAALRDLTTGKIRDHNRRLRRFDTPAWHRYGQLLTTAFHLALHRRFRPEQDRAPIIRFVATVRERYDHTGHDINPTTAETLIQAGLGEHPPVALDQQTVTVQTLLLITLLTDEGMTPTELDTFLTTAETLATKDKPDPSKIHTLSEKESPPDAK